MIVTVAALKGGVGKTTTAVLLALLLDQRRGTAPILIDGDRQGSASTWRQLAGDDWPAQTLGDPVPWPDPLIPDARITSDVVIDTGPGDPDRIAAAAAVSDVVIVPTGPRYADVSQLGPTLDVVARGVGNREITLGVLLTMRRGSGAQHGRGSSVAARQAREAIDELAPCWATEVPLLDAVAGTFGTAPARIPGAYVDLLDEIERTAPTRV